MLIERIIIGGGSGFIGSHISRKLLSLGVRVTSISRSNPKNLSNVMTWNQVSKQGLPPCDAVIQVTGANIMEKRWTENRKKELIESRIGLTKILVEAILAQNQRDQPKSFVCGSAVGYYPLDNKEYDESYSGMPGGNYVLDRIICNFFLQTISVVILFQNGKRAVNHSRIHQLGELLLDQVSYLEKMEVSFLQ